MRFLTLASLFALILVGCGATTDLLGDHFGNTEETEDQDSGPFDQESTQNVSIVGSELNTFVIDQEGNVWGTGNNDLYQLGQELESSGCGLGTNCTIEPIQISMISHAIAVEAASFSVFAITEDAELYVWGLAEQGVFGIDESMIEMCELDNGLEVQCIKEPTQVDLSFLGNAQIVSIRTDGQSTLLLDSDGNVWATGSNYLGQLAIEPTHQSDTADAENTYNTSFAKIESLEELHIVQIAAGYLGMFVALTNDAEVYTWGRNRHGIITCTGTDGCLDGNERQVITEPQLVHVSDKQVLSISASAKGEHFFMQLDDGTIAAYGRNDFGQLGCGIIGSETESLDDDYITTPVFVVSPDDDSELLSDVISVYASVDSSYAITSQGKVYVWGGNSGGILGLGDGSLCLDGCSRPIENTVLSDLGSIQTMDASWNEGLAVDDMGQVYGWGLNNFGQLGIGSHMTKLVPTQTLFPLIVTVSE